MLYSRPTKVASPELPENIEKFNKAKNIHTKMSIYFDENFYSDHRNDENCHKYIYLIYYMLACQAKYFHKYDDYDEYAQFAANTIYMRFLKKWNQGERVKSVLNYAKSTMYPLKVMYQNTNFGTVSPVNELNQDMLKEHIQSQYNEGMEEDILSVFSNIAYYVNETINNTPYKYDKIVSKRLKISCLLTLLKSFTLSKENMSKIKEKQEKGLKNDEMLYKMFNKERETSTTTWRVDPSMGAYVQVLANQVRKKIIKDINEIRGSYMLSGETLDAILSTAWDGTTHFENDVEVED